MQYISVSDNVHSDKLSTLFHYYIWNGQLFIVFLILIHSRELKDEVYANRNSKTERIHQCDGLSYMCK